MTSKGPKLHALMHRAALLLVVFMLALSAGCGGGKDQEKDQTAPPKEQPKKVVIGCLQPATPGTGGAKVEITGVNAEGGARKWVVATLQPPFERTNKWAAQNSTGAAPASIRYYRDPGPAAAIPWDGAPPNPLPAFGANNKLNYSIELTDGNQATPKMQVVNGVLRIHSVMHGDIIYVADSNTNAEDRVCVVKNFTLNDMNRVGFNKVGFHPNHAGLAQGLKTNLRNAIRFALEDGAGTAQERERRRAMALYAGHRPPLAVLDIPSARGVGLFPDDKSHVHFGHPPGLPAAAQNARQNLDQTSDQQKQAQGIGYPLRFMRSGERAKMARFQRNILAAQRTALNAYAALPGVAYVFHTYEIVPGNYHDGAGGRLLPGDPIRNIRLDAAGLTLFKPPNANSASSVWDGLTLSHVDEVTYFIDRNRNLQLVTPSLSSYGKALMVSDALRE